MLNTTWSDEMVAALKRQHEDGLSFAQIADEMAKEFRVHLTRNAVIGKARRLDLPMRNGSGERLKEPRDPYREVAAEMGLDPAQKPLYRIARKKHSYPIVRKHRKRTESAPLLPEPAPPTEPIPDASADLLIPVAQRKTLMTLEQKDCRWPVGEPGTEGFFFCGAEKAWGRPYCHAHCARAGVGYGSRGLMNLGKWAA